MRRFPAILGMTIALFALLTDSLFPAAPLAASAVVQVQATIQPYLRFAVEQQHHSFEVGEQDVRRGYVDLPQSLHIAIRTNAPDRVTVDVACSDHPIIVLSQRQAEGGHDVTFEAAELHANQLVSKSVDLRVLLAPEMAQGTYPLLLDLSPRVY
jgi:hypothetical protein